MTQMDAVGRYVKEELRPKMFEVLPKVSREEDFVVEAMSTTHVRHRIMEGFNKDLKDYTYKRVSTNPTNLKNKADSLHEKKLAYFQEDRNRKSWNGVITIDGLEYIMRVKPVITEKGCLKCHGDPSHAPRGLVKKYGTESGFGWKEGEVMGVDSVTIPLAVTLEQIRGLPSPRLYSASPASSFSSYRYRALSGV